MVMNLHFNINCQLLNQLFKILIIPKILLQSDLISLFQPCLINFLSDYLNFMISNLFMNSFNENCIKFILFYRKFIYQKTNFKFSFLIIILSDSKNITAYFEYKLIMVGNNLYSIF